ncbi:hypothetical protein TOPH_04032 [Tolypocladium ophioglossoides CBS 100239]|uniref:DUF7492 domain-containing protein n=1 Tax=Tolypocladium ophioglossoides (strain CBS 100239) TaxID=1163406 RepID=A0A0L0NAM1_TOLOC|nr:hypothetical protein TOPH_04032 [Tolypocladium ophioglossoides CBS 100239]
MTAPRAGLRVVVTALVLVTTVSAHSWIELAFRIAPNGTFIGDPGFSRGYVPRSTPGWSDKQAQHLIPDAGVYKGTEVLNKYPFDANPKLPMLEAAPGDKVAVLHLENGHVTLPQNQPNKPLNRGTVYLYGTTQPKDQEKLFDVHLLWNQDGSGGDKRGQLLATRNYDDGQCFQDNKQPIAQERVNKFAADGASLEKELKCQSVITLPKDLKPGTVYAVYWYWDWPTLKPDKIDMQATKNGQFPWAGSFMRGDKVPNGWTMDAISINESYSSVIDIRISDKLPGVVAKEGNESAFVDKQNVYQMGIKGQMDNDYDVKVENLGGSGGGESTAPAPTLTAVNPPPPGSSVVSSSAVAATPTSKCPYEATTTTLITVTQSGVTAAMPTAECPNEEVTATTRIGVTKTDMSTTTLVDATGVPQQTASSGSSIATVTMTVIVPVTTLMQTVYVTGPPTTDAPPATATIEPSTLIVTQTRHVPAGSKRDAMEPKLFKKPRKRDTWAFGQH